MININKIPVPVEYERMTENEYHAGVRTMIEDLKLLAKDGCIAAAWTLSLLQEITQEPDKTFSTLLIEETIAQSKLGETV